MATRFYDGDADLEGNTVAALGFGSQGHAHARNLIESGADVGRVCQEDAESRLEACNTPFFAHGLNIDFGQIDLPDDAGGLSRSRRPAPTAL